MRTVTADWLSAARNLATRSESSASYTPVWLVEILGINTCYSTALVGFSRERVFGDGLVFGGGAVFGGYLPAYGRDLAQGGIGEASTALTDDYTRIQVSSLRINLLNQEELLRDLGEVILDNVLVRVRLGFDRLGYDDFLELWTGVVDRLEDRLETVTLECLDQSFTKYPTLSRPLSPQYFPGTPQANKSRNIPLLLGRNTDVETIQISGAAQGTLTFAVSSGATALLLKEFGAPFPASGSITIGTETSVTYASRSYVTNPTNGLTSLQLSGLVRSGTPAAQVVGTVVTLVTPNYDYLIGYRIADLQAVRAGGAVTTSYTLLELQADAPASVLRFTSAPTEPVTVDINAGSVDDFNLLTNGGFETGTLTGYTTGAGATTSVGTSSPVPREGTYRASLEGDEDAYKDLYQEVSTVIGADYILEFYRQDSDSNLLTNGGFETGGLTGWTVTPGTALYGIADQQEPFTSPFPQYSGFLVSDAADGRYALLVGPTLGQTTYVLTLAQDVTTSIGVVYAASLQHVTQDLIQFFGTGGGGVLSTRLQTYVTIGVGTTTSPFSLVSQRQVPVGTVIVNGQGPPVAYQKSPAYLFTATATTTRLTIQCVGIGQPAPSGGGNIPPPALLLDSIRVQNASEIDTSNVGIQIGTPANPDAIYTEDLPATYVWGKYQLRFRATEAVTRITWQSRHTTSVARASYLDNMSLQRVYAQGYNPIEQIRSIIQDFLPQLTIDEPSFLTAYDRLIQWRFGTALFDPGDSRALLARMAEQCGCLLVESTGGVIKVVVRDLARDVVFGFNHSNIVQGSFSAVPERLDNVYTEFYVWFGARTGGSTQASDFAASTYCTPTQTTHPTGQALTALCQAAAMAYKRTRRLDFYADFIQDIFTANLLLTFLIQNRTVRQIVITFATWLDASHLELGDLIQVEDPRYPGQSTLYDYEIVGITEPTPDVPYVRITARSVRPSGWGAAFDYIQYALETEGWEDSFDMA
jgi:hypothetical protein